MADNKDDTVPTQVIELEGEGSSGKSDGDTSVDFNEASDLFDSLFDDPAGGAPAETSSEANGPELTQPTQEAVELPSSSSDENSDPGHLSFNIEEEGSKPMELEMPQGNLELASDSTETENSEEKDSDKESLDDDHTQEFTPKASLEVDLTGGGSDSSTEDSSEDSSVGDISFTGGDIGHLEVSNLSLGGDQTEGEEEAQADSAKDADATGEFSMDSSEESREISLDELDQGGAQLSDDNEIEFEDDEEDASELDDPTALVEKPNDDLLINTIPDHEIPTSVDLKVDQEDLGEVKLEVRGKSPDQKMYREIRSGLTDKIKVSEIDTDSEEGEGDDDDDEATKLVTVPSDLGTPEDDDLDDQATVVLNTSDFQPGNENTSGEGTYGGDDDPTVHVQGLTQSAGAGTSMPLEGVEYQNMVSYHQDELVKLNVTVRNLREDRERLLAKIAEMDQERAKFKEENLSLRAEADDYKIELSILKKRFSEEIENLSLKSKMAEDKAKVYEEKSKNFKVEFDKLNQKVRVDFNKISEREKALESQLELLKSDTEAQIYNRDNKILELKRKIDALEFNMENMSIQEQKSKDDRRVLQDRMENVMQTLRATIGVLEDEELERAALETAHKIKKETE